MHCDSFGAKRSHHVRKSVTAGTRGYSGAAHGHVGERRGTGRAPPASAVRSRVRHACGTGRGPGRRALHTAPLPASGTGPRTSRAASELPSPSACASRPRRPPTGARRARPSRVPPPAPRAFGKRRGAPRRASSLEFRLSRVPHGARAHAPEGAVDGRDGLLAFCPAASGREPTSKGLGRRLRAVGPIRRWLPQMSHWPILVHVA